MHGLCSGMPKPKKRADQLVNVSKTRRAKSPVCHIAERAWMRLDKGKEVQQNLHPRHFSTGAERCPPMKNMHGHARKPSTEASKRLEEALGRNQKLVKPTCDIWNGHVLCHTYNKDGHNKAVRDTAWILQPSLIYKYSLSLLRWNTSCFDCYYW